MNQLKIKSLDFFIDFLLIAAIFEKIQYSLFTLFDILSIIFVVCICVLGLTKKIILRDSKIKILYVAKLLMLVLYILQGVLILVDGRAEMFDQYYKGMLVSGVLNIFVVLTTIYYMSVFCEISTNNLFKKFVRIGSINVIYNVIQYFNQNIDYTLFVRLLRSSVTRYGTDAYGAGIGRLTGLFTDSNNNAAFLLIYFMIVFIVMRETKSGKKRAIYYLLLAITSLELILTYSRTGWLGMAVCVAFIFFKEGLFKNIKLVLLIIFGISVGIYAFKNSFVFHQVMTARVSSLNSNNSHLVAARDVLGIVNQSPVFYFIGVGINCLSVYYEVLYGRVGMKAHSLYLQVLCESGIIGLVLTFMFWGIIFIMAYKVSKTEFKFYGIPIVVFCFLIINLTYDSAFQPIYYWILAMTIIPYKERCLDRDINVKSLFDSRRKML